MKTEKTITGDVDPDVLDYTVGDDPVLDMDLVRWDCLGTAAHVTMLSEMPVTPPVVTQEEAAVQLGRSPSALANKLRLLRWPTASSSCASRTRMSTWPWRRA